MVLGFVVAVIWLVAGNKPLGLEPIYAAIIASLVGLVVGSLATKPPSDHALRPFFDRGPMVSTVPQHAPGP